MAEKVKLSTFWLDEEGWAGEAGKVYKPGSTASFEDANHARILRDAGVEATDGGGEAAPAAKRTSKRTSKKAAASSTPPSSSA